MGKKSVLLGFVEAVNFIDEEDGAGAEVPIDAGALDDGFDVFFARGDGGDFDKVGIKFVGQNAR